MLRTLWRADTLCGADRVPWNDTVLVLSSVLIQSAEVCLYAGQILRTVPKPAGDEATPRCGALFFTTGRRGRWGKKKKKSRVSAIAKSNVLVNVIDGVQMNISGPLLVPLMQNHQSQLVPRQPVTRGHSQLGLFLLRLRSVSRLLRQACLSQTP